MKKNLKVAILAIAIIGIAGALMANSYFNTSNTGDFPDDQYLYVPTGSSFEALMDSLKKGNFIADFDSFKDRARSMGLENSVMPGRYEISKGMSSYDIIKMLRQGDQKITRLVINKLRTKPQIIKRISSKLECDSASLARLFNDDEYLKQWDVNSDQVQAIIMPYTYDFYWNTTAKEAVEKIAKAYTRFWNDERKAKAKKLNLTKVEVITIASIVDEETNKDDEKGNVASVYLNRIRKGMKLQADPTARFAHGDFTVTRILFKHLKNPSPWNTYVHVGIPPGPICTPSESSIDAVLNAPATDYIFFCAKEDFSGYHNFAATNAEHEANAEKFHKAMDERARKKREEERARQ